MEKDFLCDLYLAKIVLFEQGGSFSFNLHFLSFHEVLHMMVPTARSHMLHMRRFVQQTSRKSDTNSIAAKQPYQQVRCLPFPLWQQVIHRRRFPCPGASTSTMIERYDGYTHDATAYEHQHNWADDASLEGLWYLWSVGVEAFLEIEVDVIKLLIVTTLAIARAGRLHGLLAG